MSRLHNATTTINRDPELEIDVRYSFTPGEPESGPTWDCGGHPGSGPEIEIDFVTIAGTSTPVVLTADEEEKLIQHLAENFDDEPDYMEDY